VTDTQIDLYGQQRAEVLSVFENIRVFQRSEQRAVHKPLLILLNLARVARGEPRLVEFAQIDEELKRLLTEFGPSSAPATRHYPFWHLTTDGGGQVWQLEGPASILNRRAGATPTLGELRQEHVKGGFPPALDAQLRSNLRLLHEIAQRILASHFPESLHLDVLQAVGLDPSPPESTTPESARSRDAGFRARVLRAYEYRCCVCGFDLRIGSVTAGLEAAHIQWFQANGPDVETNGLALCALHHKIFDLGVYTILPGTYTIAFSQQAAMSDATKAKLLGYHGAGIVLPQSKAYFPAAPYLEWHHDKVFKKPRRD
jgi:putative restriction endonuclease